MMYVDQGRLDEAADHFHRAVEIFEERKDPELEAARERLAEVRRRIAERGQ